MEWTTWDDKPPLNTEYPVWVYSKRTKNMFLGSHRSEISVPYGEFLWQSVHKPEKPVPPKPALHKCVSRHNSAYSCEGDDHHLHLVFRVTGCGDLAPVILAIVDNCPYCGFKSKCKD